MDTAKRASVPLDGRPAFDLPVGRVRQKKHPHRNGGRHIAGGCSRRITKFIRPRGRLTLIIDNNSVERSETAAVPRRLKIDDNRK